MKVWRSGLWPRALCAMVSLVVDWFVRLGGVGMAGAIFHPTVARFDWIAKVEVDANGCHGENMGKMPSLEVFPPKRLGRYFWLNWFELIWQVGPESLRCAGAMLLGGFMADESHGWWFARALASRWYQLCNPTDPKICSERSEVNNMYHAIPLQHLESQESYWFQVPQTWFSSISTRSVKRVPVMLWALRKNQIRHTSGAWVCRQEWTFLVSIFLFCPLVLAISILGPAARHLEGCAPVRVLRQKSRWQGYSCSMNSRGAYEICTWPVSKGKCLAFTFILHLNLGKNRASAFHWAALRAFGLREGTGTMFSAAEETQSHRQSIDSLMEPRLGCSQCNRKRHFTVKFWRSNLPLKCPVFTWEYEAQLKLLARAQQEHLKGCIPLVYFWIKPHLAAQNYWQMLTLRTTPWWAGGWKQETRNRKNRGIF